jgi:hypothetical protein
MAKATVAGRHSGGGSGGEGQGLRPSRHGMRRDGTAVTLSAVWRWTIWPRRSTATPRPGMLGSIAVSAQATPARPLPAQSVRHDTPTRTL